MPPRSRTAHSTLRLSEYARHFVYPAGIRKTVWTRVEARGLELGLGFDWWQRQLGTVVLGYGDDGKYVSTVGGIGLSIPRQVGKTYFVLALLFILCILFPGLQVVWTSHHLRTTTKTLTSARGFARRKKIAPHVRAVRTSHGEGQVEFANRSVIMFGARSQGFGRGFDEIDVEVFDEAQILDMKALEDMIAATNQARHPFGALLFYMGTPPRKTDPSEAFTERRNEALAGEASDAIWLEIGASPDSDPDDEREWPGMNPSYPTRTPRESMLRLRKNLKDVDSWNREGRGIWDPKNVGGVIPRDSWDMVGDVHSVAVDRFALGIEVGPDQASAAVVLAGARSDSRWHVELDEHRQGATWLPPYIEGLVAANPQIRAVVGDVGGPLAAFVDKDARGRYVLKGTKTVVTAPTVKELGSGCSNLLAAVVTASLAHIGQPQLTGAVAVAGKRALGDTGLWTFSRMSSASDITPVLAMNLALIGAQSDNVKRPGRQRAEGAPKRRAVVL